MIQLYTLRIVSLFCFVIFFSFSSSHAQKSSIRGGGSSSGKSSVRSEPARSSSPPPREEYSAPDPEPVYEPEPEPVYYEPEPEPTYYEPEPEPEPVYYEPEPDPEPVYEPEPIYYEPEPEPEPVYEPEPAPVYSEPEPEPALEPEATPANEYSESAPPEPPHLDDQPTANPAPNPAESDPGSHIEPAPSPTDTVRPLPQGTIQAEQIVVLPPVIPPCPPRPDVRPPLVCPPLPEPGPEAPSATLLNCIRTVQNRLDNIIGQGNWCDPGVLAQYAGDLSSLAHYIDCLPDEYDDSSFRVSYWNYEAYYTGAQEDCDHAHFDQLRFFERWMQYKATMIPDILVVFDSTEIDVPAYIDRWYSQPEGGRSYYELMFEYFPVGVQDTLFLIQESFPELCYQANFRELVELPGQYRASTFRYWLFERMKMDYLRARRIWYKSKAEAVSLMENALYLATAFCLIDGENEENWEWREECLKELEKLEK